MSSENAAQLVVAAEPSLGDLLSTVLRYEGWLVETALTGRAAIKAARAAASPDEAVAAGRRECQWQRDQLPAAVRELVLDDQRRRNHLCWSVFDC